MMYSYKLLLADIDVFLTDELCHINTVIFLFITFKLPCLNLYCIKR